MKEGNLRANAGHLTASDVAAYASGECTPQLSREVEEHYIACAECRAQLAEVLRVCHSEISTEEQRELKPLVALGLDAAIKARQKMLARDPATRPNDQATRRATHASGSRLQPPDSAPWQHRPRRWAYFPSTIAAAVTIVMLALVGALGYWVMLKKVSPLEQGVAAMRRAFNQSPIEARVTGSIVRHPQGSLRGEANAKEDTDQVDNAERWLLQAVRERSSAATHHELGRFYLLRGDFAKAEAEFTQARQAAPRDAKLYADLGALYYEQFKKAGSSLSTTPQLLNQAIEYCQSAVRLDPKLPEAWFNLALCHQQSGPPQVAKSDWEAYLKLEPASPWAGKARSHLETPRAEEERKSSS